MTPRARSGMTLMELVIGLAITGMMALVGGSAFASIIDHKQTIREASVTTERAATLRETIRSWGLSGNVRILIGGGPRGLTRGVGATPNAGRGGTNSFQASAQAKAIGDEITFGAVTAVNPSMQSGVTIRLYIDGDENTLEHGLTMEYQPNGNQPLQRRMLDTTIDTLHVDYLDGRTGRWIGASQAATIGELRAIRVAFVPNPSIPYSPILLEPLIFTNTTRFETANLNRQPGR
jgi:prepilin-type N-terminal cleavage/methylation domain-containing protein